MNVIKQTTAYLDTLLMVLSLSLHSWISSMQAHEIINFIDNLLRSVHRLTSVETNRLSFRQ